ncbi:hypothetical protein HPP92_020384 [Vanilla planifolia]|uniref:Uncharacterized protein n=1 Tax=Vanilla planifolia TaxID=51239 RepID=A0A835Q169_VANPL|nr:hypothetical protein HPP92_020384 [Vanilla planifolia]
MAWTGPCGSGAYAAQYPDHEFRVVRRALSSVVATKVLTKLKVISRIFAIDKMQFM